MLASIYSTSRRVATLKNYTGLKTLDPSLQARTAPVLAPAVTQLDQRTDKINPLPLTRKGLTAPAYSTAHSFFIFGLESEIVRYMGTMFQALGHQNRADVLIKNIRYRLVYHINISCQAQ